MTRTTFWAGMTAELVKEDAMKVWKGLKVAGLVLMMVVHLVAVMVYEGTVRAVRLGRRYLPVVAEACRWELWKAADAIRFYGPLVAEACWILVCEAGDAIRFYGPVAVRACRRAFQEAAGFIRFYGPVAIEACERGLWQAARFFRRCGLALAVACGMAAEAIRYHGQVLAVACGHVFRWTRTKAKGFVAGIRKAWTAGWELRGQIIREQKDEVYDLELAY